MIFSVTDIECKCGVVKMLAGGSDAFFKFDRETNEYNVVGITESGKPKSMIMYHCCFCGGRMPKSIRGELFHRIEDLEEKRLLSMFDNLTTFEDAFVKFGIPEFDYPKGSSIQIPESENTGPVFKYYRRIVYTNKSQTVEVHISEDDNGRLHVSLQGKCKKPG